MNYVADLHVHSPYARATSKAISPESLYQWAQVKGIDVVGTGDFTHPVWLALLKDKLLPAGNGFYCLKDLPRQSLVPGMRRMSKTVYFCLSTEVSTIYSFAGRLRKSHHLIYAPDFQAVDQLNKRLSKVGDLAADGRPILKLSARNLLEIVCETGSRCHLIPAHIWTPWFSIFGAKSGYDAIQDVFKDLTEHIFALETGLSSDPTMNWRVSDLDRYTLVSNSDAHSPQKLGREANRFDTAINYDALFDALHTRKGFKGTLEYFPEQGKYHLDGHRVCALPLLPRQTLRYEGRCPKCKKPVTVGVLHRVEDLADRVTPQRPTDTSGFDYIVPLPEIIAQVMGYQVNAKRVHTAFAKIINQFGSEFRFLLETPIADIEAKLPMPYAIAVNRLRSCQVKKYPGYDGVYGKMVLWEPGEIPEQLNAFA